MCLPWSSNKYYRVLVMDPRESKRRRSSSSATSTRRIRKPSGSSLQQICPFDVLKTPCFRENKNLAKAPPARKVSVKNQSELTQPTESSTIRQRCELILQPPHTRLLRGAPILSSHGGAPVMCFRPSILRPRGPSPQ